MSQFLYALAESGDVLDLDIYSDIGAESFWSDSISAAQVRRQLRGSKAKTVNLRIMSDGGDVFEAADMFDQLAVHPGRKVVHIGGLAASAASYLAMVGDEIVMGPNAWLMIHNPHGGAQGGSDKIRAWADVLDKAREQFATAYAKRSGQSKEKVLELMAAETWLTADEALELGFIDRIDAGVAQADVKAQAMAQHCFAAASVRDFTNVPAPVREMAAAAQRAIDAAQTKTTPRPEGQEQQPQAENLGEETMTMKFPKNVIAALKLDEGADENTVCAAIGRLQESARIGGEVEQLLGVTGGQAIGAVRALKETASSHAELAAEVGKVKASLARRDFESARDQGLKDKKLTPATAKLYSDRLEATLASGGDAAAVASDLQGFLAVAPRIVGSVALPPAPGQGNSASALQWNGKAFADLKPIERHNLKAENPELYNLMRSDWQASQAH